MQDKYTTYEKIVNINNKNTIDELLEKTKTESEEPLESTKSEGIRYCLSLPNNKEGLIMSGYFDLLRCFRVAECFSQVSFVTVSCDKWEKVFCVKNRCWHNFSEKMLPVHLTMPIKIESTNKLEVIGIKLKTNDSNNVNNIDLTEYGFRKSFEPIKEYLEEDWSKEEVCPKDKEETCPKCKKETCDYDSDCDDCKKSVTFMKSESSSSGSSEYEQAKVYYGSDNISYSCSSSSCSSSSSPKKPYRHMFYDSD